MFDYNVRQLYNYVVNCELLHEIAVQAEFSGL